MKAFLQHFVSFNQANYPQAQVNVAFFDGKKIVEVTTLDINLTAIQSKADWTLALMQAILTYANHPDRAYNITTDDVIDFAATLAPAVEALTASVDTLAVRADQIEAAVQLSATIDAPASGSGLSLPS